MRNVTFPQLGLEFNFNPVAIEIGPVQIRWYALIIAAGFILAAVYCYRRAKYFGVDLDRLTDMVLAGLIGGIIGARLYFVLFKLDYYVEHPLEIFQIWTGGLAIYGGIIGALLAAYLVARWRKIKFGPVLDLAGLGFLIGQGIGRWANFINVEAFGSNTDLPWGMSGTVISNYLTQHASELSSYGVTVDPSMPVHPTFLYESLWCLLGFLLLHLYFKHRKFDGEIFLMYSAWYGLGRFVIEGLRTDSLMLGKIRISQLLAGLIVVVAVAFWLVIRGRIKRDPYSKYAVLYVTTEEAQDILKNGYKPEKGKKKNVEPEQPEEEVPTKPDSMDEDSVMLQDKPEDDDGEKGKEE